MGVSGYIPATNTLVKKQDSLSKLNTALIRAKKAVEAEQKGKTQEALDWWNLLFNKKFKYR